MGMKSKSNHFPSRSCAGGNIKRNNKSLRNDYLQFFAKMPTNISQIKHIMANRKGHLSDTTNNRLLLEKVSSDENNYIGKDSNGNRRYSKIIDGKQIWVSTRNGIIQNGGINEKPFNIMYDKKGGFKK